MDQDHCRDLHGTVWQRGDPIHITTPAMQTPTTKGNETPSYLPYLQQGGYEVIDSTHGVVPTFRYRELKKHFRKSCPPRGGRYIFTSCKPIMKEVPLVNALALIKETISG